MVHEAEHAGRVYAGTNCGEISACTFLKDGIAVEEEEAAPRRSTLLDRYTVRKGSNRVFRSAARPEPTISTI